ncbi:MAG: uroporphyrinogen-III synthase [Bryobacteraceae bacterium]|nr:uroporphyrinogen-III synthase [Bryobacteraceae bacterium]
MSKIYLVEDPGDEARLSVRAQELLDQGRACRMVGSAEEGRAQAAALQAAGVPWEFVPAAPKAEDWGTLPLFGQRIVVTRAAEQAGGFVERLRALGAEPVELATIAIRPAADKGPLDAAIERLEEYDWLLFTSVNGVRFFLERLDASRRDLRALRARLCAIGPATRAALEALHLKVDIVPDEYVAESLLAAFEGVPLRGQRVLLPRAAVARDLIPAAFAERGASIDVVEAYRTVVPEESAARAREIFAAPPRPDWVTFTSSSTVKNFLALAGHEALQRVKVASIGPVTSETARRHGVEVTVEAREYTIDGLVDAITLAAGRPPRPRP